VTRLHGRASYSTPGLCQRRLKSDPRWTCITRLLSRLHVSGVLGGKLLEDELLVRHAVSNIKGRFASSPELKGALLHAIIDPFDAYTTISTQVLGTCTRRPDSRIAGVAQLYEALWACLGAPHGRKHRLRDS
jgi:hypothetical protein